MAQQRGACELRFTSEWLPAAEADLLIASGSLHHFDQPLPLMVERLASHEPGVEIIRRKLQYYPLNPAHGLWFELIDECGFPFLKTELLLRNPIGIPDLSLWRSLVPPSRRPLIDAHLRVMSGKR